MWDEEELDWIVKVACSVGGGMCNTYLWIQIFHWRRMILFLSDVTKQNIKERRADDTRYSGAHKCTLLHLFSIDDTAACSECILGAIWSLLVNLNCGTRKISRLPSHFSHRLDTTGVVSFDEELVTFPSRRIVWIRIRGTNW